MANKAVFTLDSDWLGMGEPTFSWQESDSLIAVCGSSNVVHVLDRQGKKYTEMPLPENRPVKILSWDKEGEVLAILQDGLSYVLVWNINSKSCTQIDVGSNDRPSFVRWSKTQPVLAIGSDKGSIVFYNKSTQRKIPTVGKHSSRIVTGDWNADDLLITGAEDKTLTVSTINGDTKMQASTVKSAPNWLLWGNKQMATMVLNSQTVLVYYVDQNLSPLEISFQHHYGRVLFYKWYQNDRMVVACSEGWLVAISTHISEMGNELHSVKLFSVTVDGLAVCRSLGKAAVAGDNMVKIISLSNFKESKNDVIEVPMEAGRITGLYWTNDGQILSVATTSGKLFNYLMIVPSLYSACGTIAGVLAGLTEVAVIECAGGVRQLTKVKLEVEPTVMALGAQHLAAAINTSVWYYRWKYPDEIVDNGVCVNKRDYRGSVRQVVINHMWTATLSDGICSLHLIESDDSNVERHFPEDRDAKITSIAMSPTLLFLADTNNRVRTYHLQEKGIVSEIRMDSAIESMCCNLSGTRLVVKDVTGCGHLCIPVNEKKLVIPNFSGGVSKVIWDVVDHNVFICHENEEITGYIYSPVTLNGPCVEPLRELLSVEDLEMNIRESKTTIDKSHKPILLANGILYYHSEAQGNVKGNYLSSHTYITQWRGRSDTVEGHYRYFLQNLILKRFKQCYLAAERLGGVKIPEVLGSVSLSNLDLEIAEKAYHLSKNVGMVYAIRSVKHESEKQILLGHVAMILNNHDQAQEFYLKSSQPQLALELRSDLQDWLIALQLAHSISPDQEPILSKKLALQLETQSSFGDALKLFERAAAAMEHAGLSTEDLNTNLSQSYAGIARCSIRTGDITRGYKIALDVNDPQLKVDCAGICEQMNHPVEAAQLYQRGGQPEKAASIYIKLKKWREAADLMDVITTPKLLIQLAKAKENEGNFREAEEAYTKAGDYESVVRLCLGPVNNPEKARGLIMSKCPTQTAAAAMAEYYERKGDKKNSIEFLIMADKKEDAFVLAQSYDLMDTYADVVLKKDPKNSEEHMKIAQFFEGRNKPGLAARHYERAGNPQKSLQLYMHSGDEFYFEAIQMAVRTKSDVISMQLYDFFMGEVDGIPKDPIFLYEFNRAMGKLKETAKIAYIIACEEQESGNYKQAHSRLVGIIRDMRKNKLRIPLLLQSKLMVIHSYVLVKRYVQMQNHLRAAYLLGRVAKNISQFPAHTVQILTSTVIECIRAGLREAAYTWACVLVRPEYRNLLDEKYKKQIEKVAIKRPKAGDPEENTSPCPYCGAYIFESELECQNCKNTIPFCIASGKRMQLDEWTQCPNCYFPANLQDFTAILEADSTCPICDGNVNPRSLKLVPDPRGELKAHAATADEENEEASNKEWD